VNLREPDVLATEILGDLEAAPAQFRAIAGELEAQMSELHPVMRQVLERFGQALKGAGLTDMHSGGPAITRAFMRSMAPPSEVLPAIERVEDREIQGPAGPIPIRVYYPVYARDLPVLVWFHGGGWVAGGLDEAELTCRRLSNDVGCAVVSVDYRLAPETPFPGALDDCYAGVRWVTDSAVELGIDPGQIAVGGDSAGGNLAACVALRARNAGLPLALQLLVYPAIDTDFSRPSHQDYREGYLLTGSFTEWAWDCYVPDPRERTNPEASPIHAGDLTGLPPALILTAEFDPLRDEGEAYGEALAAAGVRADVRRYEGVVHAFYNLVTQPPVEEVQMASADSARALRRAFGID